MSMKRREFLATAGRAGAAVAATSLFPAAALAADEILVGLAA